MEQWRPHRRPSHMRVTLTAGASRRDVSLLDVSEMGMKLACSDPPPRDAIVTVSTPRIARDARVLWAERGAMGLSLSEPLSSAEQAELAGMTWGY